MCGIVGLIDKNTEISNKQGKILISDMLKKIAHRGPDNNSFEVTGNVYFGHTRLSILDLAEISNQPMKYKDYLIIFNGEIYNYLELKEELINIGHEFVTNGDTEVILHAYEEWGINCQNRFKGMWAFVIYDIRNNFIFGSRDRFGIKPFYFYNNEKYFAFSSEIKPLLSLMEQPKPNFDVISTYLVTNLTNINEKTFFEDILQMESGKYFTYDLKQNQMTIKTYYDLQDAVKVRSDSTYKNLEDALNNSINIHIRSDVPLGTCLSGGVDSSTVTGKVASLLGENKLYAVTAKSISPNTDESNFAKIVANSLNNVEWSVVEPDYDYFKDHIERCLYYQEEPVESPSVFMQYAVMQKANDIGIKVMMDGQGGDETLLGYERYYTWMLSDFLKRGKILSFLKSSYQITKHSKLNLLDLLKQYVYFNNINVRIKYLKMRYPTLKNKYLESAIKDIKELGLEKTSLRDIQILEITKTNLPTLLKYEDRNSMLASIEARVPFVDHEFIEVALNLPVTDKIKHGYTKYALRKYSESLLPSEISWRKDKKGFEAPTDIWISKHKEIMEESIKSSEIIGYIFDNIPDFDSLNDKDFWKLYNIAVWEKQYFNTEK